MFIYCDINTWDVARLSKSEKILAWLLVFLLRFSQISHHEAHVYITVYKHGKPFYISARGQQLAKKTRESATAVKDDDG